MFSKVPYIIISSPGFQTCFTYLAFVFAVLMHFLIFDKIIENEYTIMEVMCVEGKWSNSTFSTLPVIATYFNI